ncbi:hypothetical protein GGTG_07703 [Gaeumannomyces tritici R3-111a-1]|uniref:Uncharacterized protein n=1 Tax=Gaeumannomyces tritici (strain R3-111a-1) TaxID=644352 RepID=J3P2F6_GAET3|nr:hypothetical protein GGTG_07703 [Gaeumannomyces tritici R3-111a-1]EJT73848.1 hypothetical protein GGTG_07703 [Gaeumannomyces tritici R3-111a-1]
MEGRYITGRELSPYAWGTSGGAGASTSMWERMQQLVVSAASRWAGRSVGTTPLLGYATRLPVDG